MRLLILLFISLNLHADPALHMRLMVEPVLVFKVDRGRSDFAIRRCVATRLKLQPSKCLDSALIVAPADLGDLRETLTGVCAKAYWPVDRDACKAKVNADIDDLAKAEEFAVKIYPTEMGNYTAWAMERIPEIPRVDKKP